MRASQGSFVICFVGRLANAVSTVPPKTLPRARRHEHAPHGVRDLRAEPACTRFPSTAAAVGRPGTPPREGWKLYHTNIMEF